jgi:hypothetical protein
MQVESATVPTFIDSHGGLPYFNNRVTLQHKITAFSLWERLSSREYRISPCCHRLSRIILVPLKRQSEAIPTFDIRQSSIVILKPF